MRFFRQLLAMTFVVVATSMQSSSAAIIDFNDLTPVNFFAERDTEGNAGFGIAGAGPGAGYQGFEWGYRTSLTDPIDANVPTGVGDNAAGWASGTSTAPFSATDTVPATDNPFAWNIQNPLGLVIEFPTPQNVLGADFARLTFGESRSADALTLYGYDENMDPAGTPVVVDLTSATDFTRTDFSFTNLSWFEIRTDELAANQNTYFAVDNLEISAVPEPSSLALLGFVAVGGVVRYRRRSRSKQA